MNKLINVYKTNKQKIFYVTLVLYTFLQLITITDLNFITSVDRVAKIGRYLCYLVFAVGALDFYSREVLEHSLKKFVSKNISYFKEHLLLLVFGIVCLITTITSKGLGAITMFLLFVNASEYDFNDFLKYILYVNVAMMLLIMSASVFKIIPDVIIERGNELRHSYGYMYPTEFMSHYSFILLIYITVKKGKFEISDLVVSNIINVLIFAVTDSRLDFLVILLTSVVAFICYKNKSVEKHLLKPLYTVLLTILAVVVSYATSFMYNGNMNLWSKLNQLLSKRLMYSQNAIRYYGLGLFGKNIEWVGRGGSGVYKTVHYNDYNFVDCSFIQNAMVYGLLFLAIVIFMYILVQIKEYRANRLYNILPICFVMIISVVEPRLISIQLNPFILLLGSILVMSNKEIINLLKGDSNNE